MKNRKEAQAKIRAHMVEMMELALQKKPVEWTPRLVELIVAVIDASQKYHDVMWKWGAEGWSPGEVQVKAADALEEASDQLVSYLRGHMELGLEWNELADLARLSAWDGTGEGPELKGNFG
jgi:hypothetical protein